ncbi:MAG: hypothetical protein OSA23_03130 [Rhodospirillales bacterium]|nr:hypothetical protein [Rhodospirillales bacterium]
MFILAAKEIMDFDMIPYILTRFGDRLFAKTLLAISDTTTTPNSSALLRQLTTIELQWLVHINSVAS